MKKIISLSIVCLIILTLSACTNKAYTYVLDDLIVTTNSEDNIARTFSFENGERVEIKINGYSELVSVISYEGSLYCYGLKDNKRYVIKQDEDVIGIELPNWIPFNNDICIYKKNPVFMNSDGKFYKLDFDKKEIVYLFDAYYDDCTPNMYFSVNDNIILYYAIINTDVNYSSSVGELLFYNGTLNRIGSGILPMEYNDNVIFTSTESQSYTTKIFNFSNNSVENTNIEYLSSVVNESYSNNNRLININNNGVVYCDGHYNIYYWDLENCRAKKIMHLTEEIFLGGINKSA